MQWLKRSLTIVALFAGAVVWQTNRAVETAKAERVEIHFLSKQMGSPVEGQFNRVTAAVMLDSANPGKSRAEIDVDLNSIDTGSDDANLEVKRAAWFDTARYPSAKFISTSVRSLGGERYEAAGKLTIKGRTRDVVVPFAVKQGVAEGKFSILRSQFAIGEGEWADPDTVANEVEVRFRVTLR
jgi:polyisoprenoid-binding protein YceI